MKLQLKIAVLLVYIALCTHIVLAALDAEPAVVQVPMSHGLEQ